MMLSNTTYRRLVNGMLTVVVMVATINLNPNTAQAQPAPPPIIVLPPDLALMPEFHLPADDPELDSVRWKAGVDFGYVGFVNTKAHGFTPLLKVAIWGKIFQHVGLEGLVQVGWSQLDFKDDGEKVNGLIINGLIQVGYRSWGDKFQFLAGAGYGDMRDFTNAVGVSAFLGTVAFRYQPWRHAGFEVRYTAGPAWTGCPDPFFQQLATAGGYAAF